MEYASKIALMAQEIERLSINRPQKSNSSPGSSHHSNMNPSVSINKSELEQKYKILESLHIKLKG